LFIPAHEIHLDFDIKKLLVPIDHHHRLLLIGSCFTENIGEKLKNYKFPVLQNPNGILFNPVSVAEALTDYIENTRFSQDDLFTFNEGWHSWKHHSRFSGITSADALSKINSSTNEAHGYLKQADFLMITLGSSFVYTFTEKAINAKTGSVAANNHQAPSDWFYRRLMTTEEVLHSLDNLIHRLFLFNPRLQIILPSAP
jgi:hypothetical protein